MELLDFLVTSETRKELLKLLWGERANGSALQLAKLIGASYASTYEELEAMVSLGLAQKSQQGRANHYQRNESSPFKAALGGLLGEPMESESPVGLVGIKEEEVLGQLEALGAPLSSGYDPKLRLSLEQILVAGVRLARKNATVARVLPVVFSLQKDKLDFRKLYYLAQKAGAGQPMGFFLDLTSQLDGSKKLKSEALKYTDKRRKRSESFFEGPSKGEFLRKAEAENTPRVAKKWHFTMNMDLENFASLFRKST